LFEPFLNDNPLLQYSAEHWFTHVKGIEGDADAIWSVLEYNYNFFHGEFC
jgi:hypothetical protein